MLLQRVCKLIPSSTLSPDYLKSVIESKSFVAYFEPILTGVSVPHISSDQIANFRFPSISREEQDNRMDALGRVIGSTFPILKTTDISIDRLREYRAALITAAVTGQIDVDAARAKGTVSAGLDRLQEAAEA